METKLRGMLGLVENIKSQLKSMVMYIRPLYPMKTYAVPTTRLAAALPFKPRMSYVYTPPPALQIPVVGMKVAPGMLIRDP